MIVTDIDRLIVSTLRADAALKALTGATTTDPRVYVYYAGTAVIDPTQGKRGYLTYMNTADPERLTAVGGAVWSLAIWADTFETAKAMRARVLALLDSEGQPERTLTINGQVYHPVKVNEHYSAQENTKFAGVQLQFRFGYCHV